MLGVVSVGLACGGGDEGTSDEAADTGEPFEPVPARGDIVLTEVAVNQGVEVTIATDGEPVAEPNTVLVAGRDALIRAYWAIPPDWQARPIEARLELGYPDGTGESASSVVMVDGASSPASLDQSWSFRVPAEALRAGTTYHLSLWEAGPGAEDLPTSTTVIAAPIGGPLPLGLEADPAELRVVMIPVVYTDGAGCSTDTSTLIDAEAEQKFQDYIYERYPIQRLEWRFRRDAPIVHDTAFVSSLSELFPALQQRRVDDGAAPNDYYYAIVDVCAGSLSGTSGLSPDLPDDGTPTDTKDWAPQRIAVGLWVNGNEPAYTTMVHELGHNHGRGHVACAVPADDLEPDFPYPDGGIGVWGHGLRSGGLYDPSETYDLMSYCNPRWVSDWSWSLAYQRIRTLSSWDSEG